MLDNPDALTGILDKNTAIERILPEEVPDEDRQKLEY